MKILAIDTTNELLTVVLLDGDATFSRVIGVGKSGHSPLLIPTVDEVLKEGKVSPSEIEAVAAVVGPGSFTGIRIGVAAATAISYANGGKRIAVNSFELLAYNRAKCTAAIDAGHGNTYLAECEAGKIISTDFASADEPEKLNRELVTALTDSPEKVLAAVVAAKVAAGETVKVLEPVYMRKSQAERNAK